jgi:hypothetical protein
MSYTARVAVFGTIEELELDEVTGWNPGQSGLVSLEKETPESSSVCSGDIAGRGRGLVRDKICCPRLWISSLQNGEK